MCVCNLCVFNLVNHFHTNSSLIYTQEAMQGISRVLIVKVLISVKAIYNIYNNPFKNITVERKVDLSFNSY